MPKLKLKFNINTNLISIIIAVLIFIVLSFAYYLHINLLNFIAENYLKSEKIDTNLFHSSIIADILFGLTIYLKTSVDFALLIGNLMSKYPGFKNRVAIENGTALGNVLGTIVVLTIWFFFKEIVWLLAIMLVLAALVLFEMAKSSLEHVTESEDSAEQKDKNIKTQKTNIIYKLSSFLNIFLDIILKYISPVLNKIMPSLSFNDKKINKNIGFFGLIGASFTIPFILGLDDFAGYVPIFNVVNVLGFGIGIFLGHMILNILLFISPKLTIKIVKLPIISFLGGVFFILLAFYGLFEAFKLVFLH